MTHYRSLRLFLSFMILMIAGSFSAQAQDVPAAAVSELIDQLTMDDLQVLNDNKAEVYLHNNRVTFVDGTCTAEPVNSLEDAAAVVASMTELLGGDALTRMDVADPYDSKSYALAKETDGYERPEVPGMPDFE